MYSPGLEPQITYCESTVISEAHKHHEVAHFMVIINNMMIMTCHTKVCKRHESHSLVQLLDDIIHCESVETVAGLEPLRHLNFETAKFQYVRTNPSTNYIKHHPSGMKCRISNFRSSMC